MHMQLNINLHAATELKFGGCIAPGNNNKSRGFVIYPKFILAKVKNVKKKYSIFFFFQGSIVFVYMSG